MINGQTNIRKIFLVRIAIQYQLNLISIIYFKMFIQGPSNSFSVCKKKHYLKGKKLITLQKILHQRQKHLWQDYVKCEIKTQYFTSHTDFKCNLHFQCTDIMSHHITIYQSLMHDYTRLGNERMDMLMICKIVL